MSYLLVTPATAMLQSLLTRSITRSIAERLREGKGEFTIFYNGRSWHTRRRMWGYTAPFFAVDSSVIGPSAPSLGSARLRSMLNPNIRSFVIINVV